MNLSEKIANLTTRPRYWYIALIYNIGRVGRFAISYSKSSRLKYACTNLYPYICLEHTYAGKTYEKQLFEDQMSRN
jgi:hypothetical protein